MVEIRTLIEQPVEIVLRQEGGPAIPRDMLARMALSVNGQVALAAAMRNGASACPYQVFFPRIERMSDLGFAFADERGRTARATPRIVDAWPQLGPCG